MLFRNLNLQLNTDLKFLYLFVDIVMARLMPLLMVIMASTGGLTIFFEF